MTPQQFWDEDSDLFFAYQKAYYNKVEIGSGSATTDTAVWV